MRWRSACTTRARRCRRSCGSACSSHTSEARVRRARTRAGSAWGCSSCARSRGRTAAASTSAPTRKERGSWCTCPAARRACRRARPRRRSERPLGFRLGRAPKAARGPPRRCGAAGATERRASVLACRAMQDPAAEELRLPQASADALRAAVEEAQRDRAALERHASAVREVVYRLDQGTLRVAEKESGGWTIHGWIQQAINLFFGLAQSETYS